MVENVPLSESFWWAIATATTVGYGDVSPHTAIGKLTAVMLMFVGIGFYRDADKLPHRFFYA
ncbi:hypothetical protein FC19_GL001655 [Liquorilactobacillus aquaticus DSM 21051]|uniref:Potassium channel domain-containing protein n=1 Tax=Liquorilactobacillus aquaticus DSM 21051 TaxID=1423725 RepID=A0A0R2D0N3_9LACO|nr:potassium channel family protein [Liquorilactobacillus aquaticus]KRM97608.1 hypothetical protein FC19_GL001655 [Liquorilactobacillus aquaticus DSM 21051]